MFILYNSALALRKAIFSPKSESRTMFLRTLPLPSISSAMLTLTVLASYSSRERERVWGPGARTAAKLGFIQ